MFQNITKLLKSQNILKILIFRYAKNVTIILIIKYIIELDKTDRTFKDTKSLQNAIPIGLFWLVRYYYGK